MIAAVCLPAQPAQAGRKLIVNQTSYVLGEIPQSLTCTLCNQLLQNPMQDKTGDGYCKACLETAVQVSESASLGQTPDLLTTLTEKFPNCENIQYRYSKIKSVLDTLGTDGDKGEPIKGPEKINPFFPSPDKKKEAESTLLTCQDCDSHVALKDLAGHSLPHIVKCGCRAFTPNTDKPYRARLQQLKNHRQFGVHCQYCGEHILCSSVCSHERVCLERERQCPVKNCQTRAVWKGILEHIVQFSRDKDHSDISCPLCPGSSAPVPAVIYPAHFNAAHNQLPRKSHCPYCAYEQEGHISDGELLDHVSTFHPDEYVRLSLLDTDQPVEENQQILLEAIKEAHKRWQVNMIHSQEYRQVRTVGTIVSPSDMQDSAADIEDLRQELAALNVSIKKLQMQTDATALSTYDGAFLWRIPDVSKRLAKHRDDEVPPLYSPPFHTSRNGYQLCIQARLNGDGASHGTHLSLYIVLMKGMYDGLLEFPFKQAITFILLDQNENVREREPIVKTFGTGHGANFHKPVNYMNRAMGIPNFCTLDKLKDDTRFVKDDVMYIHCHVNTSKDSVASRIRNNEG